MFGTKNFFNEINCIGRPHGPHNCSLLSRQPTRNKPTINNNTQLGFDLHDILVQHPTRNITIITIEGTEEKNKPCRWVGSWVVDDLRFFLVFLFVARRITISGLLWTVEIEKWVWVYLLRVCGVCTRWRDRTGHAVKYIRSFSISFVSQYCPHRCDGAAIVAIDELGRRRANPLEPTSECFPRVVTDIVPAKIYWYESQRDCISQYLTIALPVLSLFLSISRNRTGTYTKTPRKTDLHQDIDRPEAGI